MLISLNKAKTLEYNTLNNISKQIGDNSFEKIMNKSTGSLKKRSNKEKEFKMKLKQIEEIQKANSFELKEEDEKI